MSTPSSEINFLGIQSKHNDHHFHLPPRPSPRETPKMAFKPSHPCTLPFLNPSSRSTVEEELRDRREQRKMVTESPLTIFYKGSVSVFNVPRDMAEAIMTFAGGESSAVVAAAAAAGGVKGDEELTEGLQISYLPFARRKSLQRFLEKRRERLKASVPYTSSSAFSSTESDGSNVVIPHRKKYSKQ